MMNVETLLKDAKVVYRKPNFSTSRHIVVSIPAIREEKTIGKVIHKINKELGDSAYVVICVKDANDPTIAEAIKAGADAIILQPHSGYGLAHITAMRYGLTINPKANVVIMVDGDDTYDLSKLKEMVNFSLERNAVVIGDRLYKGWPRKSMTLVNYIGNVILSRALFRILFNAKVSDTQTGLKVIPSSLVYMFKSIGMEFSTEVLVIAIRKRMPIISLPIEYYPRSSPSKLRAVRDFIRIIIYMSRESIIKFLLIGFLSLLFAQLVLVFLLKLNFQNFLALLVAGESSIWFGFTLNDRVYAREYKSLRSFFIRGLKYNLNYVVSVLMGAVLAYLIHRYTGLHLVYSNFIVSLILVPVNYYLNLVYTWSWGH
jgi:putative flippase GtrA